MVPKSTLLTVPDAAEHFDVSEESVRRSIRAGKLDATKLGRGWRVDVSRFAERARCEATERREKHAQR